MALKHIPNFLTCLRFVLVGPVIFALLYEHYLLALYLFAVAGLTDGLDGLLARFYGWTSRFGAIADPLADKILLMSSFIALWWLTQIPVWLVIIIIARDIWIMAGVLSYRYLIGEPEFSPTAISKINTFLQLLLVILLLVHLSVFPLSQLLLDAVMLAVAATSLISLLHYTWVWTLQAIKDYRLAHQRRVDSTCPANALPKAQREI